MSRFAFHSWGGADLVGEVGEEAGERGGEEGGSCEGAREAVEHLVASDVGDGWRYQ